MELEIKVMWCKGLTAFNFFQKLTVYTAVSIISEVERIQLTQHQKQEQKTPVDENGEGNPEWNYPMKFDLRPLHIINPNMNDLSLLFEFRNPGQFFGDKIIGDVRVPIRDLIQSVGSQVVRFVKYEVRNPEGKHNGILDFSYKVIGNNSNVINSNYNVQITGYHHHHHHHRHDHDQQLHQSHEPHCTNSNSHDQQLNQSHSNLGVHIIESQHYNHDHNNYNNNNFSTSNSEMIQYPKIELDEQISIASAPPLVYPPSSMSSSSYYASSSSFTSTNVTHYQLSAPLYPPPSSASQTWGLIPPPPSHFPPSPLQQPYIYPPPPLQQPQPYGETTHLGYYRSGNYHQWQ